MKGLALAVLSLSFACQADERNYSRSYAANDANAVVAPEGEAASVGFENLPKMRDNSVNINIGVTSQKGAVKYKYALLTGTEAEGGSSACSSAKYSSFIPLVRAITRNRLPEGHHLLCARGKDAAGIAQQAPTTFTWVIDTSVTVEDEEEEEGPAAEELPEETSMPAAPEVEPPPPIEVEEEEPASPPMPSPEEEGSTPMPAPTPTPMPSPEEEESTPMPAPAPNPPVSPSGQAEIKIGEGNNGRARQLATIAFSNGETSKISVYVHNQGSAPLNWRMQSDSSRAIRWLQAEYDGQVEQIPDDGENAIFEGVVAAGSKSGAISFSLKLDMTGKVAYEYLEYKDPAEYKTRLIFHDDDNDRHATLEVSLYVPKMSFGNNRPRVVNGKKKNWQLSLPKDSLNKVHRLYINNRGKGNLSWQVAKSTGSGSNKVGSTVGSSWTQVSDSQDWFLVRKQDTYVEMKLSPEAEDRKLRQVAGKSGWRGNWGWVIFDSNSGSSYSTQQVAGRKYFRVCFEEKTGEHKNNCGNSD